MVIIIFRIQITHSVELQLFKSMIEYNAKRNRTLSISVIAILLVAVSTAQLSSMNGSSINIFANNVYAQKYSTNFEQAASLVNNCSGDHESSQICVNTNPQTQGKDNDVNTRVTTPPGPAGPDQVLEKRQVISTTPPGTLPIVQPGQISTRSAECNSDEVVTGGGYRISTGAFGVVEFQGETVTNSIPAWTVTIQNRGDSLFVFEVIAECVKLVDAP
ncbi:MAG: hypothetical protein ACRD8Z_00795 [Nitrososphaeraceae archaeon]